MLIIRPASARIAGRRGEFAEAERLLDQAVEAFRQADAALDTIPWLYELRDLHQARGSRAKAVVVMARALDLMSQCGSERGVEDVEEWLRTVDTPKLTRLALERHFPEYLVQELLDGRMGKPRSTRQEVAVLFSDIRDYTTMTEGLGPEEVVEILNEWFTEATRAIRKHGGVVDKFIGDAIMALFGIPEPRPDAAADAVRAALEMRDALATLNMRNLALGGKEIRIGIGIDCGEAVVGYLGSHLRQSYTAIGDTVNTASRLESATKEHHCDILISGAVEAVQRSFRVAETRFEGKLKLKGREEEEPAYRVLGLLAGAVAWKSEWGVSCSRVLPYLERATLYSSINYTNKTTEPSNSTAIATVGQGLPLPGLRSLPRRGWSRLQRGHDHLCRLELRLVPGDLVYLRRLGPRGPAPTPQRVRPEHEPDLRRVHRRPEQTMLGAEVKAYRPRPP